MHQKVCIAIGDSDHWPNPLDPAFRALSQSLALLEPSSSSFLLRFRGPMGKPISLLC